MIRVSVLYPAGEGKEFDATYYLQKHMFLVRERLGGLGLVRAEVDTRASILAIRPFRNPADNGQINSLSPRRCVVSGIEVVTFDRGAEVSDHREIGGRRLALGREVVTDEDRVGDMKAERLKPPELNLSPSRNPYLFVGIQEAKEAEDLEADRGGERRRISQRRPRDRDQEVQRD